VAYFGFSADVRGWLEARGLRYDPERPEIDQVTPEMLTDPEMWAQANPGMGIRISLEHVADECGGALGPREFAVERLGITDPPDTSEDADRVISREHWAAAAERDQANRIVDSHVFAVDVNPDQTWGSISVAGVRDDGLGQFAVVAHERGTDWIVARCLDIKAEYRRARFVVDKHGPAGDFVKALKEAGVRVLEANAEDYRNACIGFVNAVKNGRSRYPRSEERRV